VILPIAIDGLHGSGDLSVYCNFEVDEGSPGEARVATFYYPHWKATVNGKGKEVVKDEGGAIIIPLGAETSAVNVHWEEPFRNKVAVWVSVGAWIAILLITLASRRSVLEFVSKKEHFSDE